MNKESRGNILESTRDNIFVPQHTQSVLNADVSSERGSSSQAQCLKIQFLHRPPKVMNVLKTAPQHRISVLFNELLSPVGKRCFPLVYQVSRPSLSSILLTDSGLE